MSVWVFEYKHRGELTILNLKTILFEKRIFLRVLYWNMRVIVTLLQIVTLCVSNCFFPNKNLMFEKNLRLNFGPLVLLNLHQDEKVLDVRYQMRQFLIASWSKSTRLFAFIINNNLFPHLWQSINDLQHIKFLIILKINAWFEQFKLWQGYKVTLN